MRTSKLAGAYISLEKSRLQPILFSFQTTKAAAQVRWQIGVSELVAALILRFSSKRFVLELEIRFYVDRGPGVARRSGIGTWNGEI
jgi:hypothetical protein